MIIDELHRLLSTSTPTGYQTMLVSIITTILTSILLYNFKLIGKSVKKGYIQLSEFILPVMKDTIINFRRTIRLLTNRVTSGDIAYLRSKKKRSELKSMREVY